MSAARVRYLRYYLERSQSAGLSSAELDTLLPQLENVWRTGHDTGVRAILVNALSDPLEKHGSYDILLHWYLAVLDTITAPTDRSQLAIVLNNIGRIVALMGSWLEAQHFLLLALHHARQCNFPQIVANALSNLAGTHVQLGAYSAAIDCYTEAIALFEGTNDHKQLAQTLESASLVYLRVGDQQRAVDGLQRALALQHDDEAGRLTTLNSLALLYDEIGDYEQALFHFEQGLRYLRVVDDRPNQANCLQNIANTYAHLGRHTDSLLYFEQALTIYRAYDAQPQIATTLHNMGHAYMVQLDYSRALSYLYRALHIREQLQHQAEIAATLYEISLVYSEQHAWEEALAFARRASSHLEVTGELSSGAVKIWYALGILYAKLEQWDQAAAALNKTLVHWHLHSREFRGRILANLANVYANAQQWEASLQTLQESLAASDELDDATGVAQAYSGLGSIYYRMEAIDQALDHYFYAHQAFRELGDWEDAAFALQNIGIIYSEIGDWESAVLALREALPFYAQAESAKLPQAEAILVEMLAHISGS